MNILGFKQIVENDNIEFKNGFIYFVRNNENKEDGYLYLNGKKYGTSKNITSSISDNIKEEIMDQIMDSVLENVGDIVNKNIIFETVYPIGSIYTSVSDVSPSILFGFGEWEQIKDTFLLSAGDIYNVGQVGGESEHVLTIDEIPSHSHTFDRHKLWDDEDIPVSDKQNGYGVTNKSTVMLVDSTSVVGGNLSHNNMPPYLVVYVWKRIS